MNHIITQPRLLFILILLVGIVVNLGIARELPEGWFKAGNASQNYQSGTDTLVFYQGKSSGYITSINEASTGFGTLMQMCQANEFRGKRIRMSAYVKSKDIEKWAGVWFRIDGPENKALGFDNMQDRPIKGTADWKKYEIVLDVPETSVNLAFGLLLEGKGQIWIDAIKFEPVSKDVPTTKPSPQQEPIYPEKPLNLDFELK